MQPEEPIRRKGFSKKPKAESERPHKGKYRGHFADRACGNSLGKSRCYMRPVLNEKYDALYCPKCLIWLETKCDKSKNCQTCAGRTNVKKALGQ